jgi:hypothetical protein
MMASVPHVTSGSGLRKFLADDFFGLNVQVWNFELLPLRLDAVIPAPLPMLETLSHPWCSKGIYYFTTAHFYVIMQRIVISYRRFRTNYRSTLQETEVQKHVILDKLFYNVFKIPMGTQKNFFIDNLDMPPQNISPALH